MKSKRYWLFGGDDYYAGGGMKDFRGCFDSVESARNVALTEEFENRWSNRAKCEWWS